LAYNFNIIPSSATSIDYWAFTNFRGDINVDAKSKFLSSVDGVLFDKTKTKLFRCPISKTGIYSLPTTVTYIGHAAFYGCRDLTSIILSPSLMSIIDYAFIDCGGLTSINIPASVRSIGLSIFDRRSNFNIIIETADGVLFDEDKTRLMICSTLKTGSYTIPSTVTSIDPYAFYSCKNITTISIPSSVSTIGESAFAMCVGLTGTLIIPSSVTKIENGTFEGCDFTSVILPKTITSIGEWAFISNNNNTLIGNVSWICFFWLFGINIYICQFSYSNLY